MANRVSHNAAIVNTYAVGAKNRVNSKNNVQYNIVTVPDD